MSSRSCAKYTAAYSRNSTESKNIYEIKEKTSEINDSSIYQIWDFTFTSGNVPPNSTYYFGFQTQRLNSFDPFSLLVEQLFCTVTNDKNIVLGNVLGQITYPDKGSGSISSQGSAIYQIYSSSGIFKSIRKVKIIFKADLTRDVFFY